MSKRRMLDTAIWSNDKFMDLPPLGRLLQIGLIDFADDQGRCKGSPIYLRSLVFLGDADRVNNEEIRKWLKAMADNGTILIYQVDGRDYIQLLNWWKYQVMHYAMPSDYPAPDGWQDRIRFNGKGNINLTHNWVRADGTQMEDTCDTHGNPLPFVEQLPRKNLGGRPSTKGKEEEGKVPENVGGKVGGKVGGNVGTFPGGKVGENVPGKVNKEYDQEYDQEEEEKRESKPNGAKAPPPSSSKVNPCIKAYHELHNRYPTKTQMAVIIEHDLPLDNWRRAIHAWEMAGHNRTNIQGMIDWALDPSRFEDSRSKTAGKDATAKRSYLPEEYSDIILGYGEQHS
jgi:hypothetical protein